MSWIKTLWLWKEVALCLLLGLSLVWGHMWWIAGVLVPAVSDSRRCPLLIKFFHSMFYSRLTAWTQCHSLWLAIPVPTGEPGPAGPGGQDLFKGQDTKTCDPAACTHLSALHHPIPSCPLNQSDIQRRSSHSTSITHTTCLVLFMVALHCGSSTNSIFLGSWGKYFGYLNQIILECFDSVYIICMQSNSMWFVVCLSLSDSPVHAHVCFFFFCCANTLTWSIQK